VGQREARNGFVPSHPQMAGGENVEPLLIARPSTKLTPQTRNPRFPLLN